MQRLRSSLVIVSLALLASACSNSELPSPVPEAHAATPAPLPLPEPEPVWESKVELLVDPSSQVEALEQVGLDGPVAALHDPAADVYLVANLPRSGAPAFITSVLPDGTVESARWIDGASKEAPLGQPAAMALVRNRLIVSDGQHLRVFDRQSGAYRASIHVPTSYRLSDVAIGARGEVFVTDSGVTESGRFGTVFRVGVRGGVSAIAHSSVLGRPTGIVTDGSQAWIAAREPVSFYAVAPSGRLVHGASPPVDGELSGMVKADDQVVFSSLAHRTLFAGPVQGPFTPIATSVDVSGDLGWDASRRRLLVPCAEGDRLELHPLPPAS
ncbi:MAG: hypothetical protein ACPGU1_16680 [Myxococcota bacterium]